MYHPAEILFVIKFRQMIKHLLFLKGAAKKISFCMIAFALLHASQSAGQPTVSFNQIAAGLTQPLEIKNAGDGSGRLFIAEQGGRIKIYKDGSILSKPFLDIHSLVGTGQFLGIWSIAFSPNYVNNREFFIFYTDKTG